MSSNGNGGDHQVFLNTGGALRVAILGATGAIGKQLLQQLLENPAIISIVALVRREGAVVAGSAVPKLTEKVVDFNRLSASDKAFQGVQQVYCCLGSTIKKAGSQDEFYKQDHDVIVRCAQAAKAEGVEAFSLVSSVGASINTSNFYLKTKGEIEVEVLELNFNRTAIFKPSVLEAVRGEARCGECCGIFCARWICGLCICCCCSQYGAINVSEVARAMLVDSLRQPKQAVAIYDGSGAIMKSLPQK